MIYNCNDKRKSNILRRVLCVCFDLRKESYLWEQSAHISSDVSTPVAALDVKLAVPKPKHQVSEDNSYF